MRTLLFYFLIMFTVVFHAHAQADKKINENFYRFTVGAGIAAGGTIEGNPGICGTIELAYQRKKQLFAAGVNGLSGLHVLRESNFENEVNSVNVTYGRAFVNESFWAAVNCGISFIEMTEKGAIISSEYNGFIFGNRIIYEKITTHIIGLALSGKAMSLQKYIGGGLELFVNVNSKASFGGINLCLQLGKLKNSSSKKGKNNSQI